MRDWSGVKYTEEGIPVIGRTRRGQRIPLIMGGGDWPTGYWNQNNGKAIHSASFASIAFDGRINNATYAAAAVWPAANRAIAIPFILEFPNTVQGMTFVVGTQSGNYDIGLYDERSNRKVSKGSTAVPVAGLAPVTLTSTLLAAGLYFATISVDNTTAAVNRSNAIAAIWAQVLGIRKSDLGSVTLPDPITFANPGDAYCPALSVQFSATW